MKDKLVVFNQVYYVLNNFSALNNSKAYDKMNITIKIKNPKVIHKIVINKETIDIDKNNYSLHYYNKNLNNDLTKILYPVEKFKSIEVYYKNIYKNPTLSGFKKIMDVFIKRIPAAKRKLTKEYVTVKEIMF